MMRGNLIKTLHNIIIEEVTAKEVHQAADSVGMKWDNNKKFMAFSKRITGKEHIDDMTSKEREELIKRMRQLANFKTTTALSGGGKPKVHNPDSSPYDDEGKHVLGFDNRKDSDGEYELYWGEDNIPVSSLYFQQLLDTWLHPEPERFCTLEEFRDAYPELSYIVGKYNIHQISTLILTFGCILIWSTKYGRKELKEEWDDEQDEYHSDTDFPAQAIIEYWQKELGITDWVITTERISPEQIDYNEATDFIGIERNFPNKTGIIYHDRDLYEEAIIHELVHVQQPSWSEDQVNAEMDKLMIEKPFLRVGN